MVLLQPRWAIALMVLSVTDVSSFSACFRKSSTTLVTRMSRSHAQSTLMTRLVRTDPLLTSTSKSRLFQTNLPEEWDDETVAAVEALLTDEDGGEYDEESMNNQLEVDLATLPYIERAWRYAKKPLLRIGSKGATFSHGNSLRQLLEAHTVVKVKINTRKFGALEDAFQVLKSLAEDSGAPPGIELIQARDIEKTILFGMPGTLQKIENEEFPPKIEPWVPRQRSTDPPTQ